MDKVQVGNVNINNSEVVKWLYDHQAEIVAIWHVMIQDAGIFPQPLDEFRPCLQKILVFLMKEISGDRDLASRWVLDDFISSCMDEGISLSIVMDILLALPASITQAFNSRLPSHLEYDSFHHALLLSQKIHLAINTIWESFFSTLTRFKDWQKSYAFHMKVMRASSYNFDTDKLLRILSDEICKISDMWMCNSFLIPDFPGKGNVYYLVELPEDAPLEDHPDYFMMDSFKNNKPSICYDAASDPRTYKPGVEYAKLKSLMAFPMIANETPVAVGLISTKDYYHFSQDEIDQVMGIANSGAIAIENARTYEMGIQLALTQERNHVAQEMHDDLAQSLVISKLNLNILLQKELDESTRTTLQTAKKLIDAACTDLRANIYGLRETDDLEIDIVEGIKEYINTFMALSDIEINLAVNDECNFLPTEKKAYITRIVEEGLSNIRKHSRARHAWISSTRGRNEVRFIIEDDGIGIRTGNIEGIGKDHFGMKMMAERAKLIGASLIINQRPSGGTCITLAVPF